MLICAIPTGTTGILSLTVVISYNIWFLIVMKAENALLLLFKITHSNICHFATTTFSKLQYNKIKYAIYKMYRFMFLKPCTA